MRYADHKEKVREIFEETLVDYRDYPHDPGFEPLLAFEKIRQDHFVETRRKAREI